MTVGAVLLGAGYGRRFGSDKRLHLLDGTPIAALTTARYRQVFDDVFVVIRPEDAALRDVLDPFGVTYVEAPEAHLGMGHSLAAAAAVLIEQQPPWHYAVIGLLDMPFVRPSTLAHMTTHLSETDKRIVRFAANQPNNQTTVKNTHPIAWPKHYFARLGASQGDEGGRRLLTAPDADILWLETEDAGVYRDIDHLDDLKPA